MRSGYVLALENGWIREERRNGTCHGGVAGTGNLGQIDLAVDELIHAKSSLETSVSR